MSEVAEAPDACHICGIPLDAEPFDAAGFLRGDELPRPGETATLVRVQLHPQYCGVLETFAQYSDLFFRCHEHVETPGLEWRILQNGQPIAPYQRVESIVNPWGYTNHSVAVRLVEHATVEFVVHNRDFDFSRPSSACLSACNEGIKRVGGRVMGRYWYNPVFGDRQAPAMERRGS